MAGNTQRTMKMLREGGAMCAVVERWNQYGGLHGVRNDLFGIIDVLAISKERGILGIQVCAMSGRAAHLEKLTVDKRDESIAWLQAGGHLEIHAWRKLLVKRGGKAKRWTPDVTTITLDMLGKMR